MSMPEPAALFFDFWLSYAANRTPGRHGSIQMTPEAVRLDLDHDVDTLAGNENLAATELHRAEARFLEWAAEQFPDHDLGGWKVRLGAPDGPVLSDFWCGLMAHE